MKIILKWILSLSITSCLLSYGGTNVYAQDKKKNNEISTVYEDRKNENVDERIVQESANRGMQEAEELKYQQWLKSTNNFPKTKSAGPYWKGSSSKRYFYDANGKQFGLGTSKKVIDVSKHQGVIDWNAVKSSNQVDGAIVRLGYGWYSNQYDEQAARNIKELNRLGIPYGVYLFSYAQNANDAKKEADFFASLIKKYNVKNTYPIYYDIESWEYKSDGKTVKSPSSVSTYEQIISSFMTQMKNKGYSTKVYSYRAYLQKQLKSPSILKHVDWIAAYTDTLGYTNSYNQTNSIGWQYTSSGSIPGIKTRVDISAFAINPNPLVTYQAHLQNRGWISSVNDGITAGTTGQSLQLEGIKIILNSGLSGNIEYSAHVQDIGWQPWVKNGQLSGTTGKNKRIEAIKIKLTGDISKDYDVYYRVHSQKYGWLGWTKNGSIAGTIGECYRAEAIQFMIVGKGLTISGNISNSVYYKQPLVSYRTHIQDIGDSYYVSDGVISGTTGKALRIENVRIDISKLISQSGYNGNISYSSHIQDRGWLDYVKNNCISGTYGKALQLEAVKVELTGEVANYYDIYYRMHIQSKGWTGWAKNNAMCGSTGLILRGEAIEIKILPKNAEAPGSVSNTFYKK